MAEPSESKGEAKVFSKRTTGQVRSSTDSAKTRPVTPAAIRSKRPATIQEPIRPKVLIPLRPPGCGDTEHGEQGQASGRALQGARPFGALPFRLDLVGAVGTTPGLADRFKLASRVGQQGSGKRAPPGRARRRSLQL